MQKQITSIPKHYIAILVALTGLGTWTAYRSLVYQSPSVPVAATETPKVRAVAALGRIEPAGSVIKVSVVNAKDSRVEKMLVQEGSRVQAGQIIAILQGLDKQQAAVTEAEKNLLVQQAKLRQTQVGSSTNSEVLAQKAVIARLQAQMQTEILEKQASMTRAAAELRNAEANYQRYQKLFSEGAVSAVDLDNYRKNLEIAQAQSNEIKAQLDNIKQTLKAQIGQEQATLTNLSEVRPVDVQVPQTEVDYAYSQLASAKAKLEDFYVRVPVSGQILRINTRVGEQVNADAGIVDLGQTDQMYVIAEVYETDVPRVSIGQRAVALSENGGFTEELQGTVEHIGLQIKKSDVLGTDPAADQNARVVEVKIRLNPADSKKVAGLTYMQVRVKLQPTAE